MAVVKLLSHSETVPQIIVVQKGYLQVYCMHCCWQCLTIQYMIYNYMFSVRRE